MSQHTSVQDMLNVKSLNWEDEALQLFDYKKQEFHSVTVRTVRIGEGSKIQSQALEPVFEEEDEVVQ